MQIDLDIVVDETAEPVDADEALAEFLVRLVQQTQAVDAEPSLVGDSTAFPTLRLNEGFSYGSA